MKKIYFVLLMNYKDTFFNFEAIQKGMEDTLNPPPDIASLIFKNLKKGISERGIEPKDIRGMNEIEAKIFIRDRIYQAGLKQSVDEGKKEDLDNPIDYEILGVPTPTSTPFTNIENFTNIPLKQQFSFTKLKRNIENFGDIYDRRINEYDNCEGVGEIIEKIRKGDDPSWKSSQYVAQVDCEPVYDWDGKFYKDEASAKAGSTAEKIMEPSQDGTKADGKATSATSAEEPGSYVHKTGKFLMSSVYSTGAWSTPSLDGKYGWLARSDRQTSPGWMRMETVSGNIEMIKGVVTKGYNSDHHTSKFKVYVSRNGDAWKQMKDSSGNEEFTGGVDQKTNYFKDGPVEAKYIKFYPTAGGTWRSLKAGYIKDLSGAINCTGGSGLLKTVVDDEPYFRFTFNEAKTNTHGIMSQGTSNSTKNCPSNGQVMIAQKETFGIDLNTDFVEDKIKLVDGIEVKGLKEVMKHKTLPGCGGDPTSNGWGSSESFASSKTWSACKIPTDKGLLGTEEPFHTDDGGFRYMYRHWSGSNNNGYNKMADDYNAYKDNTQSSDADNGSTYIVPSTDIKIVDYENVNVIRQPCNRGVKGTVPTPGDKIWTSTTPYVDGMEVTSGASGYMGEIRNLSGGVEGWIDELKKYKWSNDFNEKIEEYTAGDTVLNDYEVEEKEGTNGNNDNNSWGEGWRGSQVQIDGDKHYHTPKSITTWKTGTSDHNMTARYRDYGLFIPIGIRIQPHKYGSWEAYSPTVIRFRLWHKGTKDPFWCKNIVLGKFKKDEVKTILLPPKIRKEFSDEEGNGDCDHFYVYTRHGYDTNHTAFRINFLVGQRGTGKKCVEKSWTATSPHRPIDCTTTTSALKTSRNPNNTTSGWNSYSNCWVSGKGCGDWESDSQYWESRQVTTTTWKDKTVNAPNYGGKNDCKAESDIDKTSTTVTEEQNVRSCGNENCSGSSCSHCPGRPTCYVGSTQTWKCNPGGSTGWTWDRIVGS